MKRIAFYYLLLISIFAVVSCEKPPGPGGKAQITGTLVLEQYDPQFRVLQSSEPAKDRDVFIIYGNSTGYSDDVTTAYDGTFKFKFLAEGEYTIFTYSAERDNPTLEDESIITKNITINKNDNTIELGEITIYERMDIDDGHASIQGQIRQINYSNDFLFIKDTTNAQELDVYLVYENDEGYCERTRTLYDGTFAFKNLIKGSYQVIVYSEDTSGGTENIPIITETGITNTDQINDIGIQYITIED